MRAFKQQLGRRNFLQKSSMTIAGSALLPFASLQAYAPVNSGGIHVFGPREGFSPQVSILVSMLDWMRDLILRPVKGLSTEDLDFLLDDKSNTIGAMLLHLAATERFYQIHTFKGKDWGDWSKKDRKMWTIPSGLGNAGRREIKGHPLSYYLDQLTEVREHTLKELAKRDDEWLMKVDKDWFWGPTNNWCKWFHVCEHESNHNGQIKYICSRLPSRTK